MTEPDPYRPPASGVDPTAGSRSCPECGHGMEVGEATGRIYWTPEGTSALRRFIAPGRALMGGSFRITMTTPRAPGHHCRNCGLTILKMAL
ncbi:PF20097 family protein [Luteolibacter soli]|uniref:PF20097 family protein n=1 Tax=Luteolibacter soli TaxID=3135280 RepID=UPI0035C8AEA0